MKKSLTFSFLVIMPLLAANPYYSSGSYYSPQGYNTGYYQDGYYSSYPQYSQGQYYGSYGVNQPYSSSYGYSYQNQPYGYSSGYSYQNQPYTYGYQNYQDYSSNVPVYGTYGYSQTDAYQNRNDSYRTQNVRSSDEQTKMTNDPMRNYNPQAKSAYDQQNKDTYTNVDADKNFSYNDSTVINDQIMTTHGVSPADQEIIKKVSDLVHSGWFFKPYKNVNFSVMNGVVTLRGNVETLDEKKNLEDSVRKIDGVRQINNQVMIAEKNTQYYSDRSDKSEIKNEQKYPQDYAATESDRVLNSKIRDKISNGWFVKENKTLVIQTNNGVVTITGFVEKFEDVDNLNNEIRKIDGVRQVNNQVTVKQNR